MTCDKVFCCLTANGVVMKDEAGAVVRGYHFPMLIIVPLVNVSNAVFTTFSIYRAVSVTYLTIVKDEDMIYILRPEVWNDDTKFGKVFVRTDPCSTATTILEDLTKVRKLNVNLTCVRQSR